MYRPVPAAVQRNALAFLADNVFVTPAWLAPADITSRLGPGTGGSDLTTRQANVVTSLLATNRLNRLIESQELQVDSWGLADFLESMRIAVWGAPGGPAPELDAGRRAMQRAYLERLEALVQPAAPAAGAGRAGGPAGSTGPFLGAPNVPRSDLPALARAQLRSLRAQASTAATSSTSDVGRAHWQDVVDRIDGMLERR